MERILADFREQIVPGVTHWNHPRFHAYFSVSASAPGILGEMLTAALNINGMLWKSSPATTELEQVTMSWLRQWLGLPEEFFGLIYDTASTSTMHAIAAAREAMFPEVRVEGGLRDAVLYTSEHAHSSVEKGAITLGIGQKNVRKVPVTTSFRWTRDALRELVEQDMAAGLRPFCVVPTIGTTATTSIDPVEQVVEVAREFGLWVHVDAAYGGSACVCPDFQHYLGRGSGGFDRCEPAQVVVYAHRSQRVLYEAAGDSAARVFAGSGVSEDSGRFACHEPDGLRGAVGAAVSRVEVLVRDAVLRAGEDRGDYSLPCAVGAGVCRVGEARTNDSKWLRRCRSRWCVFG
jgi:hypothetical protein